MVSSAIITEIAIKLSSFSFIASLIAPIIAGENGVMAMAFLSAQGHFHLWTVIIFSFFGMIIIDSFWFGLIRIPWINKIRKWKRISKHYKKIERRIEKISHKKDMLILMISKLLIGTRILILIYLSMRKIKYSKFLLVDLLPTFIWAICLGYLGWFAGLGYYNLTKVYDNIVLSVLFILLAAFIFYILMKKVRKWLIKE